MNREDWNDKYRSVPLLWNVDPGPFLGGELAGAPPGRALDLGAGEGRTSIWLARRGWRVTAVDFSDVAQERGRRLAEDAGVGDAVTWVNADLADFVPEPAAYDLVLVLFVHPPAPQRSVLLGRAVESLAPGGTILVVGYDAANATEGEGGVRDPSILFTPADVTRQLDGMRVDRAETIQVGKAFDAIVRAVKPGGA